MGIKNIFKSFYNIMTGGKEVAPIHHEQETVIPRPFTETELKEHRLQCLTEAAQAKSDADYQKHMDNINAFDVHSPIKTDSNPLTAVEKAFLKYLAGRKVNAPDIAGYWSYEYSINFNYIVSKYINNGYLYVGNADPQKLTMPVLKEILLAAGLPTTGKKADLAARVNTLTANSYATEEYYRLTEKGAAIVDTVQDSATKDTDFEDAVLALLYNQQIKEAAKMVFEYRSPRQPYASEITLYGAPSESQLKMYQNYYSILTPQEAACLIFSSMMGFGFANEKKLFQRILGKTEIEKLQVDTETAENELASFDPEEEYQILCCLDDSTCPICGKMDLRHFKYKQAKTGKNYPPFHKGCRCTVVPYYEDFAEDERAARDSNGKTIYVPGNMKWTKWKQIYGKTQ